MKGQSTLRTSQKLPGASVANLFSSKKARKKSLRSKKAGLSHEKSQKKNYT